MLGTTSSLIEFSIAVEDHTEESNNTNKLHISLSTTMSRPQDDRNQEATVYLVSSFISTNRKKCVDKSDPGES